MDEKEYIEREAVLKAIRRMDGLGGMAVLDREDVENAINNAPAADVVEVVHGEWIKASCSEKDGNAHCSECNHWDWSDCKYCSECGAKMDGERKEQT